MGERIKVLHVCTTSLTAQVFIAPLARYLSAKGYRVVIACSPEEPEESKTATEALLRQGLQIHAVRIEGGIHVLKDGVAILKLYGLIRRERFEIVQTQTSKAGFIGRTAASRGFGAGGGCPCLGQEDR